MDENKFISMLVSLLKKMIPKLSKKEIFFIFLILLTGFKTEILSIGGDFIEKIHGESGNTVIAQDRVLENSLNQSVLVESILEEVKKNNKSNENIMKLLTPKEATTNTVYCGINNADIGTWELSTTPENQLGLKDGDKVFIQNKDYDIHLQSAVVFVKIYRKKNPNAPDFYINEETAHCLGIEDARFRGRFTVSLKHFDIKKY